MTELPAALRNTPRLDRWIGFSDDHAVVVRTGKVEIGQGVITALAQVVADELDVDLGRVRMQPANTASSPDEGYTAGSMSIEQSATALRIVCADIRGRFLAAAAARLAVPHDTLTVADGAFVARSAPNSAVTYWDLRTEVDLAIDVRPEATPKDPRLHRLIGTSVPRRDLPQKFAGTGAFVHDLRFDGMLHGRVVRSHSPGARVVSFDERAVTVPGVEAIVREGDHVGVLAAREEVAVRAAAQLRASCTWTLPPTLPDPRALATWLRSGPSVTRIVEVLGSFPRGRGADLITRRYTRPFIAHASLLPSCAVARWDAERVEVWTHSQGIFALREALAVVCGVDVESVVVRHAEGAGCYGHNGADDVALDAVLLARAAPGSHVRVQWSHEDELGVAPFGAAMAIELSAVVDDGRVAWWQSDTWSNSHVTRPGYAGASGLLPAREARPDLPPAVTDDAGGIGRNAVPLYEFEHRSIRTHTKLDMPVRTSSLRSLGAFANVFAIESFVDELAAAHGVDPLEFRLRHLVDERARAVLLTAAREGRYGEPAGIDRGRGIGLARYKNVSGWCAVVAEVEATHDIAVRTLTVAVDVGLVVNPDGLVNQIEGGAVQATSWTMLESVGFAEGEVATTTWDTYPILRFEQVPEVRVFAIDRPDEPALGAGEIVHGPVAAAIANAVFASTGLRARDLPLTRSRLTELAATADRAGVAGERSDGARS
jgi:CO/xanthine dehydrogenase Mo-binding subunit